MSRRRRQRVLTFFESSGRVPTDEDLQRLPLFVADHIRDLRFEVDYLTMKLKQTRLEELQQRDVKRGT